MSQSSATATIRVSVRTESLIISRNSLSLYSFCDSVSRLYLKRVAQSIAITRNIPRFKIKKECRHNTGTLMLIFILFSSPVIVFTQKLYHKKERLSLCNFCKSANKADRICKPGFVIDNHLSLLYVTAQLQAKLVPPEKQSRANSAKPFSGVAPDRVYSDPMLP